MFSIWWLLAAFLVGAYAGIFLIALMQVCGDVSRDGDEHGSSGSSGNIGTRASARVTARNTTEA